MNRTRVQTFFVVMMLVVLTLPVLGQVNGVRGIDSVSRSVDVIQPPSSLANGSLSSDDIAFVFLEQENLTLEQSLRLDIIEPGRYSLDSVRLSPGNVASGTTITSYLIHFDPRDRFSGSNLSNVLNGEVTFEGEILGLITETPNVISTSSLVGASNTEYIDLSGLEFERIDLEPKDEIFFEANRNTIRFEFRDRVEIDQMRVIVEGTSSSNGNSSNEAPNARGESVTTSEDRAISIDVLDNDTDADDNLRRSSLRISRSPSDGRASIDSSTREITYTPDSGFRGSDSFEYEICDTDDLCDTATVSVTVERSGSSSGNGNVDPNLRSRTLLPEANDCESAGDARIDIVPGNRENEIRLDDEIGFTAVAILGTRDFPAPNCVDVSTVRFGPDGDEQPAESCGVVNVNFDRWDDIVCDFRTEDLPFSTSDTRGRLTADTIDSESVDDDDRVTVLAPRRFKNISSLNSEYRGYTMRQLGSSVFFISGRANVVRMGVEIFNSDGERVFTQAGTGNLMRLDLNSSQHQLANGVYFMRVNVIDKNGKTESMGIIRVVLLR